MTLVNDEWLPNNIITFMCFRKFDSMVSCVVCDKAEDSGMDLLRCGHLVCWSSDDGEGMSKCVKQLRVPTEPGHQSKTVQDSDIPTKFECRKCKVVTTGQEIDDMKSYMMHGFLRLHKLLQQRWKQGYMVRLYCDFCGCLHEARSGDVQSITDNVNVCAACTPPQFFCKEKCAPQHAERSGHHNTMTCYNQIEHEWMAVYNCGWRPALAGVDIADESSERWTGTDPQRESLLSAEARSRAVSAETSPPPTKPNQPHSEGTRLLLEDIGIAIQLLVYFERCQDNTVKELKELVPDLINPKLKDLQQYYPDGKFHTIDGEIAKASVAFRYAAHLIVLQTLIYMSPQQLDVWKRAYTWLSLPALMQACFEVWEIPLSKIGRNRASYGYVVPWYSLSPTQLLYQDMREVLSNSHDVGGGAGSVPESVVEVSVAKYDPDTLEWDQLHPKKTLPYTKTKSNDPYRHPPEWLHMVKVADNLFAVSTAKDVSLVRTSIDGSLIKYKISPGGLCQFGYGLWWNGTSLFATSLGTKHVAQWEFDTIGSSFIVKFKLQPIFSDVLFTVFDTLVEAKDELCICYDTNTSRELTDEARLQCYKFSSGNPLRRELPGSFAKWSTSITLPSLLGACTHVPYVIIRDDNADSPVLHTFSKLSDDDYSWCRIEFSFSQINPADRVVVKNFWFHRGKLCLKLLTNRPDEPERTPCFEVQIKLS